MAGIDLTRLNESQRDVVLRLDEPLFVAAGAGSGKTFTLTARLVHALSQGSGADGGRYLSSIDEALVITFTKAAALEIKDRVRAALREAGEQDAHLREESLKVDGAWISTIHGMCSRILKRHGVELGIDASFEVCDSSVAEALLARAMDEVLSEVQQDPHYAVMLEELPLWGAGMSEGTSVAGIIRQLRQEAGKCAGGYEGLVIPQSHDIVSCMRRLRACLEALAALRLTQKQLETATSALDAVVGFCAMPAGEQTAAWACEVLEGVQVPALRKKDQVPLKEDALEAWNEAVLCAHYERVQGLVLQLVDLARRVDARYGELKHERSYVDNDDLIGMALQAVESNPQVALDYRNRFKLVMIDEFQDTDERQLRLISLLSGKDARHLTTVGDAQQSIYRFRGGDVEVFRNRGRDLAEQQHVRMDVNYRSDHHVLACVEKVCGDACVLDDFLKLAGCGGRTSGYKARDEEGHELSRVFLEIAEGGPSAITSATLAAQIADRLAQLAQAGQPVGSMALLLGATTRVSLYLDALRARGLPAVVTGGSSFASTNEVGVMQALLHTLANPHDTETGLFRLLSSGMFMLDANDFCVLGTRQQETLDAPTKRPVEQCFVDGMLTTYGSTEPSERLRLAHTVLSRAFERLGRMGLADVCQAVLEESGWLERLERSGDDGLSVAANVLASVRYVRELTENLGLGVARAADEFDRWLEVAKLTPKSLAGDAIEAVQVMTIHGSKGLQFGVAAVAECWGSPRVKGRLAVGQVDGKRVLCLSPRTDSKAYAKARRAREAPDEAGACGHVAEWSAFLDNQELVAQAGEKARLLYVALTRAEEALVVGLPVAEKEWLRSPLADAMLGAFAELDELVPGTHELSLEPEAGIACEFREVNAQGEVVTHRHNMPLSLGTARVVHLGRGATKDDPWQASSGESLRGFDGELPDAPSLIACLGANDAQGQEEEPHDRPFEIFDTRRHAVVAYSWRNRENVYSYSSLQAQEEKRKRVEEGLRPALPAGGQIEADAEDSPYHKDPDKATSLGSAFHALAQTMVQTRADHDSTRKACLERTWHLSQRQCERLDAAIACWETSDLRREALAYGLVRAEVPFFVESGGSVHGAYVEGAIDLLCTDGPECRGHALVVDYKTGDLGLDEAAMRPRHEAQARLYADVLLRQGFSSVSCAFIAVETGVVARWEFGD